MVILTKESIQITKVSENFKTQNFDRKFMQEYEILPISNYFALVLILIHLILEKSGKNIGQHRNIRSW